MRSELACSTSGIIVTGTETKYKQSLLQIQNINKVRGKNKIQTKFVANTKYRNSGCKTGLGGASNDVHRKMR